MRTDFWIYLRGDSDLRKKELLNLFPPHLYLFESTPRRVGDLPRPLKENNILSNSCYSSYEIYSISDAQLFFQFLMKITETFRLRFLSNACPEHGRRVKTRPQIFLSPLVGNCLALSHRGGTKEPKKNRRETDGNKRGSVSRLEKSRRTTW